MLHTKVVVKGSILGRTFVPGVCCEHDWTPSYDDLDVPLHNEFWCTKCSARCHRNEEGNIDNFVAWGHGNLD